MKVRTWRTQIHEKEAPCVHRISVGKGTLNSSTNGLIPGVYITFSDSKGGVAAGTIAELLMSNAEFEEFRESLLKIKPNKEEDSPGIKYSVETSP